MFNPIPIYITIGVGLIWDVKTAGVVLLTIVVLNIIYEAVIKLKK